MCVRAQLPSARAERAEANFAPRGKSFAAACFKTVKLCAAEIGFKMVKVCGRPETQPPPYALEGVSLSGEGRDACTCRTGDGTNRGVRNAPPGGGNDTRDSSDIIEDTHDTIPPQGTRINTTALTYSPIFFAWHSITARDVSADPARRRRRRRDRRRSAWPPARARCHPATTSLPPR